MKHGPHNKQRTIIVQLVPVYKKKQHCFLHYVQQKQQYAINLLQQKLLKKNIMEMLTCIPYCLKIVNLLILMYKTSK